MDRRYADTVRLLLSVAPIVFEEPAFAMKGGTALNLFLHDLPRLSVDIYLVSNLRSPAAEVFLESASVWANAHGFSADVT